MEKHIEHAITREFTLFGLKTHDYLLLICVFSFGNVIFPYYLLIIVLLGLCITLYHINKKGRPFYIQSQLNYFRLEARMKMDPDEALPDIFTREHT